jgi:hypothetical protein
LNFRDSERHSTDLLFDENYVSPVFTKPVPEKMFKNPLAPEKRLSYLDQEFNNMSSEFIQRNSFQFTLPPIMNDQTKAPFSRHNGSFEFIDDSFRQGLALFPSSII